MLKKIIIFLTLFLSYVVSAQDNNAVRQGMKANFSKISLKAYQENSLSKVKDFYQYLEIFSNSSTSESLKNQIKENIYSLFADKEIQLLDFSSHNPEKITLEKLLQKLEKEENIQFTLKEEITNKIAEDYWLNSYTLEITKGGKSEKIPILQKINFYPQEKKFGNTSKQVWTITLGEIQ